MIVAGFGFRGAASEASLRDALARTGLQTRVTALATALDKAQAPAFVTLGKGLGLHIHPVSPGDLSNAGTATDSPITREHRQTGSVAEAAALSAAGPGARLLCTRVISTDRMASCAIASGPNAGDIP